MTFASVLLGGGFSRNIFFSKRDVFHMIFFFFGLFISSTFSNMGPLCFSYSPLFVFLTVGSFSSFHQSSGVSYQNLLRRDHWPLELFLLT